MLILCNCVTCSYSMPGKFRETNMTEKNMIAWGMLLFAGNNVVCVYKITTTTFIVRPRTSIL